MSMKKKTRRDHRRSAKGATILEFALVTPILFVMTLGAADFGRAHYAAVKLVSAAQAALPFVVTTESGVTQWQSNAAVSKHQRMIVLRTTNVDGLEIRPTERAWITIDQASDIPRQLRQRWEASCQKGWCDER